MPGLVDGGFNWVDVRDVVEGALAAADRGSRGERYLLAGGHATVRELARQVANLGGRPAPKLVSPMWLARMAAPFAVGYARLARRRPLFNAASLHALRNHHEVRNDKARRELGFTARPWRDTVMDAIQDFGARSLLKSSPSLTSSPAATSFTFNSFRHERETTRRL